MTVQELTEYIAGDEGTPFASSLAGRITASRRFRAFAEQYRDKIRRKVRLATDEASLKDFQFELEIACRLLEERRFTVEYEKFGTRERRGPDFSITFRGRLAFHVETRRMHASDSLTGEMKIANAVCDKIGQALPESVNVLLLAAEAEEWVGVDLEKAMKGFKDRLQRRDDAFFAARGFRDAKEFVRHYLRLSAVFLMVSGEQADGHRRSIWTHAEARRPLPGDIRAMLERLCAAEWVAG